MMAQKTFDDLVVRDSKGVASPEESAWLREAEQVHRWIESLIRQRSTAQAHIASRRARLSKLAADCEIGKKGKPLPGVYLDRKREVDQANQGGRRFIGALGERLTEAKQVAREVGGLDAPSLLLALITVEGILNGASASDAPVDDALKMIDGVMRKVGAKA